MDDSICRAKKTTGWEYKDERDRKGRLVARRGRVDQQGSSELPKRATNGSPKERDVYSVQHPFVVPH